MSSRNIMDSDMLVCGNKCNKKSFEICGTLFLYRYCTGIHLSAETVTVYICACNESIILDCLL